MSFFRFVVFVLLMQSTCVVFADESASSTVDPQKVMVINELLETTGGLNLANQMMAKMMDSEKKAHPEIDAAIWDRMAKKLDVNDLRGSLIEIYDRHFSTADLQAVLNFYKSPPGQKMLKELPAIVSESMIIGQEWGRTKTQELKNELQYEKDHPTKRG